MEFMCTAECINKVEYFYVYFTGTSRHILLELYKKSHFHEPINYHSSYQSIENEGYFSFVTIKMSSPILNARSVDLNRN
jgi:hypothetical protein